MKIERMFSDWLHFPRQIFSLIENETKMLKKLFSQKLNECLKPLSENFVKFVVFRATVMTFFDVIICRFHVSQGSNFLLKKSTQSKLKDINHIFNKIISINEKKKVLIFFFEFFANLY